MIFQLLHLLIERVLNMNIEYYFNFAWHFDALSLLYHPVYSRIDLIILI